MICCICRRLFFTACRWFLFSSMHRAESACKKYILWSLSGAIRYFDCKVPDQGNTRIDEVMHRRLSSFMRRNCVVTTLTGYRFISMRARSELDINAKELETANSSISSRTVQLQNKRLCICCCTLSCCINSSAVCKVLITLLDSIIPSPEPFQSFFLHGN